jgi:NAD-dependent SIR2 family protein deacetylase
MPCVDYDLIVQAPAVDAEPVRHGRWIHCKGKSNLWYCSECGEKIIYNPTRKTYKPKKKPVHEVNKRCRNCGAKMDLEVDE